MAASPIQRLALLAGDISLQAAVTNRDIRREEQSQDLQPNPEVIQKLREALVDSYHVAARRPSTILPVITPLSPAELAFLSSHTLHEITATYGPSKIERNPLLNFCIDILKNVVVQLASSAITQTIFDGRGNDEIREQAQRRIASESSAPSLTSQDPSVKTYEKIVVSEAKGLGMKFISKEVGEQLKGLDEVFFNYVKSGVKTAAASGVFLSKVAETGSWQGPAVELAKDVTIGFVAEHVSEIAMGAVGCTNPVWCAKVLATVIVRTFEPTITALPSQDMFPPLPPPSLEEVTRSRLPDLNPAVPAIHK